jgi:hypothetical protein
MTAEKKKKSLRKSKAFLDQDKYTAELSSGQLVLGLSALLIYGLACFMLGVVLGKFEPLASPQVAQQSGAAGEGMQSQSESPTLQRDTTERQVTELDAPPDRSGFASPWVASVDSGTTESDSSGQAANADAGLKWDKANEEGGANSEMQADDRPNHIFPPAPPTPDAGKQPPSTQVQAEATPPDPKEREPVTQPVLEVMEPAVSEDNGTTTPPANADGKPAKESKPANAIDGGKLPFSVQVMALLNRKKADAEKAIIEAKSNYPVRLEKSSTGRLVLVLVGAFATKSEAELAKKDIRENLHYNKAFVLSIN